MSREGREVYEGGNSDLDFNGTASTIRFVSFAFFARHQLFNPGSVKFFAIHSVVFHSRRDDAAAGPGSL